MASAAQEMADAKLDASFILFSLWTESIKHFAENGKWNTIFLHGSIDNMHRTLEELMSVTAASKSTKQA